jgi:hypothetical protein
MSAKEENNMGSPLMDKQYFYDANKFKWVLEFVPATFNDCSYWWIHVDGDNEKYSGFVGQSIDGVFGEFVQGGYLYEE